MKLNFKKVWIKYSFYITDTFASETKIFAEDIDVPELTSSVRLGFSLVLPRSFWIHPDTFILDSHGFQWCLVVLEAISVSKCSGVFFQVGCSLLKVSCYTSKFFRS